MLVNPFNPGINQNVTTGGASAQISLSADNDTVRISNDGTNPAYIKFGDATTGVTATTSDIIIAAGMVEYFFKGKLNALAHLQKTGATSLSITSGTGGT